MYRSIKLLQYREYTALRSITIHLRNGERFIGIDVEIDCQFVKNWNWNLHIDRCENRKIEKYIYIFEKYLRTYIYLFFYHIYIKIK